MSLYLSCLIQCNSNELAENLQFLIDRSTRPIFEEEVDAGLMVYYEVVENSEFPTNSFVDANVVALAWEGKDHFDFHHLKPLFHLPGVSLLLAHEIDSYIGSGDEDEDEQGRVWFMDGNSVNCCNYSDIDKDRFERALKILNQLKT